MWARVLAAVLFAGFIYLSDGPAWAVEMTALIIVSCANPYWFDDNVTARGH